MNSTDVSTEKDWLRVGDIAKEQPKHDIIPTLTDMDVRNIRTLQKSPVVISMIFSNEQA